MKMKSSIFKNAAIMVLTAGLLFTTMAPSAFAQDRRYRDQRRVEQCEQNRNYNQRYQERSYNDRYNERSYNDRYYDNRDYDYRYNNQGSTAKHVGIGAAIGAGVGALIGGRKGALIGAGAGAAGGYIYHRSRDNDYYRR